ncbi:hypothetical protein [Haloterrigena gelatinilytica]|uniref:hypothetical protein n=1 Tax=Haloterrigena gelatinilytica TaxID=2741724 RepID=UPI0020C6C713|nr:hypothetical protein [Haloterrigena gelatinilytica]
MIRNPFASDPSVGAHSSMLIDRHLSEYDVTTVRHAVVDADPETTYEAMLTADLLDTGPIVRALGALRTAPMEIARRLRGDSGAPPPERMRFVDVPETDEWTLLDEAYGEEFVFGAVGTFWRPAIEWRRVDPEEFSAFDEPGYAKLAIGLSVRPYGDGRMLLSYEARTATTDDRARRNFRRYWRVIGPFAGYLMSQALERIESNAEARAGRKPRPPETASGGGEENRGRANGTGRGAVALAALLAAGAYHVAIRPWHRRWGATEREARGPLPGDGLLPNATDQVTHAIQIEAPTESVWPWLVQIGQDRGGFYSYDWLERAVGADVHNVDRIVPEYQDLEEGDVVRLAPEDYVVSSPESAPEVARLDPGRVLVLRPPGDSPAWTWAFVLKPVDEGTTRLLARTRSDPSRSSILPRPERPRLAAAIDYLFWEPAHFLMERHDARRARGAKRSYRPRRVSGRDRGAGRRRERGGRIGRDERGPLAPPRSPPETLRVRHHSVRSGREPHRVVSAPTRRAVSGRRVTTFGSAPVRVRSTDDARGPSSRIASAALAERTGSHSHRRLPARSTPASSRSRSPRRCSPMSCPR